MSEQENTTTTSNAINHFYCDLPADVMAKPNTLCNLIEQSNPKLALIYSNHLDVQLVENRLCKRGYKTRKLLFPVTDKAKLQEMIEQEAIQCIVLTDNSTPSFLENSVDVIINYSSDSLSAEGYKQRASLLKDEGKIFTLVSMRDYSDFTTFCKSLEIDIKKAPHPEEKDLSGTKMEKFLSSIERTTGGLTSADKEVAEAFLAACKVEQTSPYYEKLKNIVGLLYSKHSVSTFTPNDKSLDEEINFGLTPTENEDEGDNYDDEEMECGEDCDCEEQELDEEDLEENDEDDNSQELSGTPPSTVKVRISQGLNQGLNENELRTLLREFADIQDDEIEHIDMQEDEGIIEVAYARYEDLIDNLNGIEQNGDSLLFEALTPVKLRKKTRPDFSNFRERGGYTERRSGDGGGRGGRSGGGGGRGGYRGGRGGSGGGRGRPDNRNGGGGGGRGGYGARSNNGGGRGRSDNRNGGGGGRYSDNDSRGGDSRRGDSRGGDNRRSDSRGGDSRGGYGRGPSNNNRRNDNRSGGGRGGYGGGGGGGGRRSSRSSNYNR